MKLKKRTVLIMVLIAISPFLFLPICANAQDTYNFYFQKAPGPTTVIQGQAPQQQQQPVPAQDQVPAEEKMLPPENQNIVEEEKAETSSGETSAAQKEKKESDAHWKFGLGVGGVKTNPNTPHYGYSWLYANEGASGTGSAIAAEYHFNKSIGLGGEIILPGSGEVDITNGSIGIVFTPLHIHLFGYNFIDISLLGGGMTVAEESALSWLYKEYSTKIQAYYGARVAINLTKDFGLMANYRLNKTSKADYSQASILATWKF